MWLIMICAVKGVLRAVPVTLIGLVLMTVFDLTVGFTSGGLKSFWLAVVLISVGFFVSAFFPAQIFSLSEKSKRLSRKNKNLREDDLFIAQQFVSTSHKNGSSELIHQFANHVAMQVEKSVPWWCLPSWSWKPSVLFSTLLIVGASTLYALVPASWRPASHILFPFGAGDLSQIVDIKPGDAAVPYGQDARIELHLKVKTIQSPVLYLRIGDLWQEIVPSEESGPVRLYTLKNIVEPVVYRVGWKREFSRKYSLTPASPVQLTDFKIVLSPPAYVRKDASQQTAPEITALPGTQVVLEVTSNKTMEDTNMRFAEGGEISAKNIQGLTRTFEFTVEKETSYSLGTLAEYPIHVITDTPPQLALLSPEQDLVVGEKEIIPLTYDARDDFGLGKIQLNWEKNGRPQTPVLLERFDIPKENFLGTYEWDMGRFGFHSGDQIRYQLEVYDGNTITGPGKASSPWRILEMAGFEREHAAIEAALEDWREKTVDLLAKVNTLQKRVEKDNPDWNATANEFNEAAQLSKQVETYLDRIVSKMESDPMADYSVWLEHKAMKENMKTMNDSTVKKAQSAMQTQNKTGASQQLNSMSSELERMLALSEDMSKAQKARDVLDSGDRLEELAQNLIKKLEPGKVDAETKKKVDELLKEAMENLAKMAHALQDMPESLPEDFVNQEALTDLKMNETKDIMSQIKDALERGDAKGAMDLAQSFLKATQKMQKNLSSAHESFLESRSASELQKNVDEQQKALNNVIEQQASVLSETQKLESQRWGALLKEQATLLDALVERQNKVLDEAHTVPLMGGQIPVLESILRELQKKQIDQSPEWLRGVLAVLDPVSTELMRSSSSVAQIQSVSNIRTDEKYILDQLTKPQGSSYSFSKDDVQSFSALQKKQNQLQLKTQEIKKELQNLSRKTASLSTSLMQSLGSASMEMNEASQKLGENNSQAAQRHEEAALRDLLAGNSELQQAQSSMADMAMQQGGGQGGGSPIRAIPRSPSLGSTGQRTGRVRLPKSDEYRPPKEFREDLLEALKEKYPKIYEDIIHQYYKRLVE